MKKILFLCFLISGCAGGADVTPLESAAGKYIGAPYVLGPLGEGAAAPYDSDPLRRTDAFDCLTFVETALSDARGADLQKIRYSGGRIDWFSRNHWTETEWIPNAEMLGLVRPVDFGAAAKTHAVVDLKKWYESEIPRPAGARDRKIIESARPFEMSVPYVPRDNITPELLAGMPRDALAFFIRCDVKSPVVRGDMISHAGFLFGGRDLAHAGEKNGAERIDFLGYLSAHKFCGVAFYEVL
ncbi:MAG: DUF1460 domain-containing protein [Proteobacteria bacterium]|nr:DUF1460 domain-containing protein [Pseudomonadota bacterium]